MSGGSIRLTRLAIRGPPSTMRSAEGVTGVMAAMISAATLTHSTKRSTEPEPKRANPAASRAISALRVASTMEEVPQCLRAHIGALAVEGELAGL